MESFYYQKLINQNLRYNGAVIGWLGQIISAVGLLIAGLMLHFRFEIVQLLIKLFVANEEDGCQAEDIFMNFIVMINSGFYIMAMINLIVCSLLLLGIAKRSSWMLIPWLIYHGVLLGLGLHFAIYIIVSSLYIDLTVSILMFMTLAMIMVVAFKVYNEIYVLCKTFVEPEPQPLASIRFQPVIHQPMRTDAVVANACRPV